MRRRSRTRRVLKWICTTICALIAGMWLLSSWYNVVFFYSRSHGEAASVNGGVVHVWWEDRARAQQQQRAASQAGLRWERPADFPLVHVSRIKDAPKLYWIIPTYRAAGSQAQQGITRPQGHLWIPLWLLFVLIGIPTGLLWWRDRRIPSSHCQNCGYDLTGNVSGRCPECGTAVPSDGRERAG